MFDLDYWQEVWVTISRNKFRSILTGFGVSWGIFMLVGIIAISNGFKGGVGRLVGGFAENTCFFAAMPTNTAYKGFRKNRVWRMNNKDILRIQQQAVSVDIVAPVLIDMPIMNNVVRNNKAGAFNVRGVYPSQFIVEKLNLVQGRLINEADIKYTRKSCLIGKDIYDSMFEVGEDPLGKTIQLKGIYYTVVGMVSPFSQVSIGGDVESSILIPFTTMQRNFPKGDVVDYLGCVAKEGYSAQIVEEEVVALLQEAHVISPQDEKAIGRFNVEREFLIFKTLFEGTDIFVWVVGVGTLLSGAIGVSNIMLVSVRERTKEIGVRRALGAKPAQIVMQVLSESFVLTTLFGMVGMFFIIIALEMTQYQMSKTPLEVALFIPPFIAFNTVMASFGILCFSGILAGLIPSIRALSIKAIEAIAEE